jgi:hypothetical protein
MFWVRENSERCVTDDSQFRIRISPTWQRLARARRPRTNKEKARGSLQNAQHRAQIPRRQMFYGLFDQEHILPIQIKAVKVRATSIRIFLVRRLFFGGDFKQTCPETLPAKDPALGGRRAVQIQQTSWIRAAALKQSVGALVSGEWARGIVIRKIRERGGEFRFVRVKSSPGIAVKMIDDRPGMQELLDARQIFSRDAEDHIEEFIQAERLPHERPHGHVSGFFFRVANGNRFRQWHAGRIRGERLKCRYERGDACLNSGGVAV